MLGRPPASPPAVIDRFLLVNADGGPNYRAAVALARKMLDHLYVGRFDVHPSRPVTVYVFSDAAAYERFCADHAFDGCDADAGAYDRQRATIVMLATTGAETSAHELTHPIMREDFARAPDWLQEGIAALYENPLVCADGTLTGITNWRWQRLHDALVSRRQLSLVPRDREHARRAAPPGRRDGVRGDAAAGGGPRDARRRPSGLP
jgi:hypothetical protein